MTVNTNYLYEYANKLERVLSAGYKNKYFSSAIERMISYSSYFQKIENDHDILAPIITDDDLIDEIYPESNINLGEVPVYNQCLWAAEAYMRIQSITGLSFECIFIYIPIDRMYDYFPLYHEMDFSQIVDEFIRLHKQKSAFTILCEKYGYSVSYISKEIMVSEETLSSFKQRRRNITKSNFETIWKLARLFKVRLETIAEIKI